jgi:hypothetical protein
MSKKTASNLTASEKFEELVASFTGDKFDDKAKTSYLNAYKAAEQTASEQGWEEGDEKFSAAFLEEFEARMETKDGRTNSEVVSDGLDAAIEIINEKLEEAKAAEKPAKDEKPKVCTEDGCDSDKIYSRGYCRKHYEIHRTSDSDRPDCTHPGCDQKVYTKNLCRKHYVAQRSAAAHAGLNADDRAVLVEVVEALAKMRKGGGPLVAQAREILGMEPQTASIPVVKAAE